MSYKWLGVVMLLSSPGAASSQALFAEANFSDQHFSALLENLALEETDLRSPFSGFQLYLAEVRVVDVYFGDLAVGDEIDVQINVSYLGKNNRLEYMEQPYILSFCKSADDIYYTNRDFLIIPANEVNIKEFNRLRSEGTDFDGNNDCSSTNFDLEPIAVE